MSLDNWVNFFTRMMTMIRILRDFKPILYLNLYSEHMPEERITGSKIDLDLSARVDLYTFIYGTSIYFPHYLDMLLSIITISNLVIK